jgi:hypothetical protein
MFLNKEVVETLNWYKTKTSLKDTLLSSFIMGASIPSIICRRVFLGHGMESINYEEKDLQVTKFFQDNFDDEWKIGFLKTNRIDYVLYSKMEMVLGTFNPFSKNYLELLYYNDSAAVFKVK